MINKALLKIERHPFGYIVVIEFNPSFSPLVLVRLKLIQINLFVIIIYNI